MSLPPLHLVLRATCKHAVLFSPVEIKSPFAHNFTTCDSRNAPQLLRLTPMLWSILLTLGFDTLATACLLSRPPTLPACVSSLA